MTLEFVLAIFLFRYLEKSLKVESSKLRWNKILKGGFAVAIALLVLDVTTPVGKNLMEWSAHILLLGLAYLIYSHKDFAASKPIMYAVLPYILLSILGDLVKTINRDFYYDWSNFFKTAELFAVIWMVAMWLINRKQKKVLETEHKKLEEIERENRITATLKAELEVQVSERTAALTLQKEELEKALVELKATQSQLIQSEKMASLGELTAGIAHEIQNPLNFINNFSEVNTELIAEMKEEIEKGNLEEVKAIVNDIAANEQKINHHGKRADGIVKGMLQHSRSSGGAKEPTDINILADEYLRLAYHGLRAKDKSFNATLKTDYDENIGKINVISQDIGRVILNLITNAFYAVTEKKKQLAENASMKSSFEPTVAVSTKKHHHYIEIKVRDNGNGIPQKVLDKIFQPFFTTKPTGQGTGLGLSLSYDIIKAHGGELKVFTKESEGAEFIIELPANT
jgi:two-component system, NtrC family, sensor kinase